jgi:hypothetical protein
MTMRVLVYKPESYRGELRQLDGELTASLDAMQEVVGGNIQILYLTKDRSIVAVMNQDGLLEGLPLNRCSGRLGLVGTFFVARVGGEDFVSLTDVDVMKARDMFDMPLHS